MEYAEFKGTLMECLSDRVEEGGEVRVFTIRKNNGSTRDCMCVQQKGRNVAASVCVEELYVEDYTPEEAAEYYMTNMYGRELPEAIQGIEFSDYSSVCSQIVPRLVNAAFNEEQLKECPHRKMGEFAIIYYLYAETEDNQLMGCHITDGMMKLWDVDEAEIYRQAMKNMPYLCPVAIRNIGDYLPAEAAEQGGSPLVIVSNKRNYYGAVGLFAPDTLQKVAELVRSSFWVLPSSVHEFLIFPDDGSRTREELEKLVATVNADSVPPEEVLGTRVGYYESVTGTLIFAENG